MRGTRGGTRMHCPVCGQITICAALPYDGGEQLTKSEELQIWYFARRRECQDCGSTFETVEVSKDWLKKSERHIQSIELRLEETFEKSNGANELILNWNVDLGLRIEAIERVTKSLQLLHERIDLETKRTRFLRTLKR